MQKTKAVPLLLVTLGGYRCLFGSIFDVFSSILVKVKGTPGGLTVDKGLVVSVVLLSTASHK